MYEGFALESYNQWKGATQHLVAAFGGFANDITSRRDYAAVIERWNGRARDSTLARRLALHHRDFLLSRADPALPIRLVSLQTAIQDTVGQFRYLLRGARVTGTALSSVLDTSTDRPLREAAFRARLQIAPHVGPAILHAISLNDSIGRAEGFPTAPPPASTTPRWSRARCWLTSMRSSGPPAHPGSPHWHGRGRTLVSTRLEPWDIDHWLHRQEKAAGAGTDAWPQATGLARLRDLMRAIGFAYDSLPIDVKVWDVPTGGITFSVRPGFEARLLTNPFPGSNFYETLFHEYGHALNFALMRPGLPPRFLQGDETPLGEGLAETLGHLAYDHYWLERAAGVPAERAAVVLERVGKLQLPSGSAGPSRRTRMSRSPSISIRRSTGIRCLP